MHNLIESLFIHGWRGFIISRRNALLALAALILFQRCSTSTEQADPYADWIPVANRYARSFQIMQKGDDRLLICFGAGGRTDTAGIYLVGEDALNGIQPLPQLREVVVASTTQLPFFSALEKDHLIRGVVHAGDLFDRSIAARVAEGSIRDVGTAEGLDQEQIHAIKPQAIFDHPFGRNLRGGSTVPVINVTEYLEEHPLGRAEWLKFFGVLFRDEERADRLFDRIEERYRTAAAASALFLDTPVVFFASSWQGQWFAPPANSYMARLITDAGAAYALADHQAEGNITLDLESVLHKVRRSDHFGMILSTRDSITALTLAAGEPRLARIPAVNMGGFHGNTALTDLFGQAILEPDIVLSDLMKIFHPADTGTVEFRYFKPLQPVTNATDRPRAPGIVDRSPADDAAHARRSSSRSRVH